MKKYPFIAVLLLLALAGELYLLVNFRCVQLFGGLVQRVDTPHNVVALTFDDAPTVQTAAVLGVLAEHGIPATFYEKTGWSA